MARQCKAYVRNICEEYVRYIFKEYLEGIYVRNILATCKEYVGAFAGPGTSWPGQSLSHTPGSPEMNPCYFCFFCSK